MRSGSARGATVVELTIALAILAVLLVGMVAAIAQAMRHQQATREHTLAYEAARERIEMLRSAPFRQAYALHNANPADDPDGSGTAPGPAFEVPGLGARAGRIVFPEGGAPAALRENVDAPEMGMRGGRDLNLDGAIDGQPRDPDYRILPVKVVVEWEGVRGATRFEVSALLTERLR